VTINKIRARLEQEGLYPSRFDMVPGDSYPDHSHPDAEVRWVVSGRMRIQVGQDEIILGPGDRLELSPNVVHSADVVGDDVVVTVSASR
jgi:quercetin dioxygenase-like cupin family protein